MHITRHVELGREPEMARTRSCRLAWDLSLALAYEHPEAVSDDTIETYLQPHIRSPQRTHDLERFVNAFDAGTPSRLKSRSD